VKILALNPFHGGSHRAFLEGWAEHSEHEFRILSLPGRKWKWRMRHAPIDFVKQLTSVDLDSFDGIFTTDMLDLPTFRGLCPAAARLPTVVYFHENQLTYPSRAKGVERQRDKHFAFTNLLTAATAEGVWFNSDWHCDSFIRAAETWAKSLPDFQPTELVEQIRQKAITSYPGVNLLHPSEAERTPGPMRIAWVARWEFDKNPDTFFAALSVLKRSGVPFRLNVLGESYTKYPECFDVAKVEFAAEIDHWGFAADRTSYEQTLRESDLVVSTALHEFFGLAIVEAVSAGCHPLVPEMLAYPEVLRGMDNVFHPNTPEGLANRLTECAALIDKAGHVTELRTLFQHASRHSWPKAAASLDRNTLCAFGNT
jgi:glycosyltransferase involved in cell wall biosynthesis